MPDREKVIKAWEIFRDSNPYEICSGREFRAIKEPEYCMSQMIADTINLLKGQESLKGDKKMSRVVIVEKNKDGKIELTKDKLQKMLDDAYNQGYADGRSKYEAITYPSYPVWYKCTNDSNTIDADKITITSKENEQWTTHLAQNK